MHLLASLLQLNYNDDEFEMKLRFSTNTIWHNTRSRCTMQNCNYILIYHMID